jgi:L-fuculose-phosphate aldolase
MTSDSTQGVKREVFDVCQEMLKAALVIGSSGNASIRINNTDTIAITPSNVDYTCMDINDVMIINMLGEVVEGERNPSSEYPLHLAIYQARPDVNAIIHTHCVYATTMAILHEPLPPIVDEFVIRIGGQVEVAEYAFMGSEELARNVVEALGPRNAVFLANHGAVCVGQTLGDALYNALLIQRVSHMFLLAASVDKKKITKLPAESIETQQQMFEVMKRFKKR